MLPLFAVQLLAERLLLSVSLNRLLEPKSDNPKYTSVLYQLGLYLTLANSSFYQFGNNNGLTSLSGISSIFESFHSISGLSSTISLFLTLFASYLYWMLSFFISLQSQLVNLPNKGRIHCSAISCLLIWQQLLLSLMESLTLVMAWHPFLWPLIAPKLLVQILFTGANLFVCLTFTVLSHSETKPVSPFEQKLKELSV